MVAFQKLRFSLASQRQTSAKNPGQVLASPPSILGELERDRDSSIAFRWVKMDAW